MYFNLYRNNNKISNSISVKHFYTCFDYNTSRVTVNRLIFFKNICSLSLPVINIS